MITINLRPFHLGAKVGTACCDALLGFCKSPELQDWENDTKAKQPCLGGVVAYYNKQTLIKQL